MDFAAVALQIIAVSLPILLGWSLNKLDILSEQFDAGLSRLVMNVALPASIIASIHGAADLPDAATLAMLLAAGALTYVVSIAVSCAAAALIGGGSDERRSNRFAIAFGNCGFIGLPVLSAILGPEALLFAAIVLIPANVALFSGGALMFAHGDGGSWGRRLRQSLASLKSPTLAASILVLVLALVGVNNLSVVGDAASIIGQAATPLALLITGSSMARYEPLSMLSNPRAYVAAFCRLILVPVACLGAVALMPLDPYLRAVTVLDCAMPVATVGALFCLQSGTDPKPMMQVTFLTVLGSIVSIPVVSVLIGA